MDNDQTVDDEMKGYDEADAKLPSGDCEDTLCDGKGNTLEKQSNGPNISNTGLSKNTIKNGSVDDVNDSVKKANDENATCFAEDALKIGETASMTTPEDDAAKNNLEKERVNADILENQVLDTQNLLQIVDREESDEEIWEKSDSDNIEMESEDTGSDRWTDVLIDESTLEEQTANVNFNQKKQEEVKKEVKEEVKKEVKLEVKQEVKDEVKEEEKHKATAIVASQSSISLRKINKSEKTDDYSSSSADVSKFPKRSLSDSYKSLIKLEEPTTSPEQCKREITSDLKGNIPNVHYLNAVREYMRVQNLKQFSLRDLERLCIEKVCETICARSHIQELKRQMGAQEQIVEKWKKEMEQLKKHTHDLTLVHRRLLYEASLKMEVGSPCVPLKITRSVGLQVRSANKSTVTPIKRHKYRSSYFTNSQDIIAPAKRNRFMAFSGAAHAARVMSTIKLMKTRKTKTHTHVITLK